MRKNVINLLKRSGVFSTLIVLLAACNDTAQVTEKNKTSQLEQPIACQIALSPHEGLKPEDKVIQAHQERLILQANDLDQWETLTWAYINKAKTTFDTGFYKLAEQSVQCMNSIKPNSLTAALLQGHILHNLHRFRESEQVARLLVAKRGYWFDYGLLGDALMEQGELNKAIDAYQAMLNQKPGPEAYNRAAHMRWLKGDVEGAIELLQLSISSSAGQVNNNTAWAMTKLAEYYFQLAEFNRSKQYLSYLLNNKPDYAPAMLLQGKVYISQDKIDMAVDILSQAVSINVLPEYKWALLEALSQQQTLSAEQLQTELKQHLFKQGKYEDRRTYALYLASSGTHNKLAVELAEQELQERQDVMTLDTYAWTLRANQQFEAANQYIQKALDVGTQSARLFYHAGVIAYENKQYQKGLPFLIRAKALQHNLWPSERKHLIQICECESHHQPF